MVRALIGQRHAFPENESNSHRLDVSLSIPITVYCSLGEAMFLSVFPAKHSMSKYSSSMFLQFMSSLQLTNNHSISMFSTAGTNGGHYQTHVQLPSADRVHHGQLLFRRLYPHLICDGHPGCGTPFRFLNSIQIPLRSRGSLIAKLCMYSQSQHLSNSKLRKSEINRIVFY